MSASSAPAAKAALLARMRADANMVTDAVQISYAHPGVKIRAEAIYFEQTRLDEVPKALGQQRRDESYVLDLIVSVAKNGSGDAQAQACEERCWALVGRIEDMLRPPLGPAGASSANLGGALNGWCGVESVQVTPGVDGAQRVTVAVMGLRCFHRK